MNSFTKLMASAAACALALAAGACSAKPAPGSAAAGGATSAAAAPMPAARAHSVQAFLETLPAAQAPPLTEMDAMTLAAYPLSCLDHIQAPPFTPFSAFEPPSATAGVKKTAASAAAPAPAAPSRRRGYLWQSSGTTQLLPGYAKRRAFYGCFDWHSSVNSTWTLVTLLKRFPNLPLAPLMRGELNSHLQKSNLAGELAYFQHSKRFERPYGQAWVLKLYGALLSWKDPQAQKWAANMAPFAQFLSKNLATYLTHLPTPVRIGVHPNTAFDMDLMLPYTETAHDTALHAAIVATAQRFYGHDQDCPTAYEPAGVSFLSPCLAEGALMSRLLPQAQFVSWYNNFMPQVYSAKFRPLVTPFDATKMIKSQMAGQSHLLGLAFSRAAAMVAIADALPRGDARIPVLDRLAAIHATEAFKHLDTAGYLETHWIATYALLYQLELAPSPLAGTHVASTMAR
ncbi:MAG: DUF2891 family protein [Terriglobales bacterium]